MLMTSSAMSLLPFTRPLIIWYPSKTIRCSYSPPMITSEPRGRKKKEEAVALEINFGLIKTTKRVVLVRHGQSTWNAEQRIQGSSDFSVLTKKGEAQAETSRQMLVEDSFDICFSSPLIRSKRTAEIIWGLREAEILTDSNLREIDLYSFQGLLKNEGKEKFGQAYRQWQVDPSNFEIDGHFPVKELWVRAKNCWNNILSNESRSVLVVAHNAVNQALVATAIGLGTEYFRILLQSNCGVSVLDFTPRTPGSSPVICLNRLNQTPSSPILSEAGGGRKTSKRIVLVCHGTLQIDAENRTSETKFTSIMDNENQTMNMLGIIQSQKTAELLLDHKVSSIISSPGIACHDTAMAISRVQEAADCLGADCVPRYVDMKQLEHLALKFCDASAQDGGISALWHQSAHAWKSLLSELSDQSEDSNIVVVVASPVMHIALMCHSLGLSKDWLGSFHLDAGSISILDLPDGPAGRSVARCMNYTAHLGRWSIPITKPTPDDDDF